MWALLHDYRIARPRWLTKHFSHYAVHDRSDGTGTVIEYQLRVRRHQGRHVLAAQAPVPGRMLREPDRASAWVSTWTVTPGGDGERTMMPLTVALRDPQTNALLARALHRLAASCSRASTRTSASSCRRPGADRHLRPRAAEPHPGPRHPGAHTSIVTRRIAGRRHPQLPGEEF